MWHRERKTYRETETETGQQQDGEKEEKLCLATASVKTRMSG